VPNFIRSFSKLAGLRPALPHRRALILGALLSLSLGATTAPAGAVVVPVNTGSGTTAFGLQPREGASISEGTPTAPSFNNPAGSTVLHASDTYAVYWDPTDHYHGDWQHLINTFFQGLGGESGSLSNVFAVDAQYTDASNLPAAYRTTFRGAYTDTDPYPAGKCIDPHPLEAADRIGPGHTEVCLTDVQIRTELKEFIAAHGLQKGVGSIFYLLTPPGVTVCLDQGGPKGRCSDFNGTSSEIAQYEEAKRRFPEEEARYNKELPTHEKEVATYDKELTKYGAEKELYEEAKIKDELEGKPDAEAEPVAPVEPAKLVKPIAPKEPAGYPDYKESFCSYHGDFSAITLENTTTPDANAILYAAIPWTAGGLGDYHLNDENSAYECQDGGFDPSSKPIEQREKRKQKTAKEEAEIAEKTPEEQEKIKAAEKLEGPHQQEPNQAGVGPDGSPDTGLADLIVNQISVEQQNIVTDPLLNAWQDSAGNEVTDECRNFFADGQIGGSVTANEETGAGTLSNQTLGGNPYYLNDAFNMAALRLPYPGVPCLGGVNLVPTFTAPNPVGAGDIVGFDGMESDITLNSTISFPSGKETYATYKWNFGDGSPEITGFAPGAPSVNSPGVAPCAAPWLTPCAASTFHSYQYGGTYQVTLTVIDTGGNKGSVTNPITVVGPAPPAPPSPPAPSPGGGSAAAAAAAAAGSSGAGSSGAGSAPKPAPIPGPVASQAATTRSLSSALSKGLVISYSVNEQVAGQFQVLLASSIAKRIGLHGPQATGMPPGSAPSIVIGKAILITTKGGRNTVKIQFGKKTAAKLRKLRSVQLTVRLVVRNASHSPLSTTVISTVNLSR
jgi:hypothetical protein